VWHDVSLRYSRRPHERSSVDAEAGLHMLALAAVVFFVYCVARRERDRFVCCDVGGDDSASRLTESPAAVRVTPV
jgi:hypothetical protein